MPCIQRTWNQSFNSKNSQNRALDLSRIHSIFLRRQQFFTFYLKIFSGKDDSWYFDNHDRKVDTILNPEVTFSYAIFELKHLVFNPLLRNVVKWSDTL